VAPGGTITPPSSAPPEGVTYTLYDTNGNKLYSTTGVYEPGGSSAAYSQTTYQLFKNNSVTINSDNITCADNTPPSPSLPCATVNADGVVTQLAYDPEGDLVSSATPDGNSGGELATTTYVYDADGEQTSSTAPDGNLTGANAGNYTTVTAYNNDGLKTTVTQAGGSGATVTPRPTTYGYDADGNQTSAEDARGYTTTTDYNADDKPSLVTDPDSDSTLTCYDGDGNTTQTVPAVGVAADSLTAASCPTTYPAGYSTRLAADATADTFNALGQKTQETTPAPAGQSGYETTAYTYDGNGNQLTVTAPPATTGGPSQVTSDTYNAAGQLASQTTGYGTSAASTVSYCYDPDGDKTSAVYADGNTSGTAPCSASSPWTVTASSQAGYQTTYSYDSADELVSTSTPATTAAPGGATTITTYDPAGNVLTSTDPDGVLTSYAYTPGNLKASVSYSEDSSATVAGTPGPLVSGVPVSPSICLDDQYGGTSPGNVIDIYGCNGSASQEWTANADGTLETLGNCLDVSGNGTSWGTSVVLEPCSASTPGEIWHAGADGSWVNPNSGACLDDPGATTTWGTQVHIYGCNGTSAQDWGSIQYGYDADGSKTAMTDATGTSSYAYDSFGELTSADNGAGQTTTYAYNADGNVTGIIYPLPSTATWATTDAVSYEYDHADELTSASDFNGNTITIANTADGQLDSETLGSTGDAITTSYDPTDNPSAITLKHSSTTLQSFAYSYSPAGNVLSESDTPSSSLSPAAYTYDAQGRVASMTPGSGSAKGYSFDASSNLTELPTGATGSYDNAGELTSSTLSGTMTTYAYNADGEQLTSLQGSTSESAATWNGAEALLGYASPAASMNSASYDGDGLRQTSTSTPAGGTETSQNYVWDTEGTLPQLLMDGISAYIYDGGMVPAEQVNLATGAVTYLVADSLGSVRGTVNSSGTLTGTTSYDAWGSPENTGGLTGTTPFGFAGGYTDPDGLIYLQHRYYDVQTGQFLSVDPQIDQTLQSYSYANGDPVNDTDPSGMRSTFGERLADGCSPITCWYAQLNCWRDVWTCSIQWGLTFRGEYKAFEINTLEWILYVNGIYVWGRDPAKSHSRCLK
jgi:RHS repeat-associated protein